MFFSRCLNELKLRKEIKKEIKKIKKENFIYQKNTAFLTFCIYLKISPRLEKLLMQTTKNIQNQNIDKIFITYYKKENEFSYMYIGKNTTIVFPILKSRYLNKLVKQLSYQYLE